jgi:hypothetical protein
LRNLTEPEIAKYRDSAADLLYETKPGEEGLGGAFLVPHKRLWFRVIASSGYDQKEKEWRFDHISISLKNRCPTWDEMEYMKNLFFEPWEVCYQLHVTNENHINVHPYCLHIWRHCDIEVPLPPKEMIG